MTRTKLWRLSLAAILGFGWLFLTPAYSDDPLSLAAQEIKKLNESLSDLNYQSEFKEFITVAESKYTSAVNAKTTKDNANTAYEEAIVINNTALSEKNIAQSAVNDQADVVAQSLIHKNNAQDLLDIANINLANAQNMFGSASSQGVSFEIYPLSRDWYGRAYIAQGAGLMCQGSIYSFNIYAGSGAICGLHDNIIGIFKARLTLPEEIDDLYFAGATDDGFRLYVDGVLETSLWQEQGTTWSPYTRHFDTSVDKTLDLEAWWYNGGGPGNMHIGYGYNGIWTGINPNYLSYGSGPTQEELDAYNSAILAQSIAQEEYNNKLSTYNQEVQTLQNLTSNLTLANQNLTISEQNLTLAQIEKENSTLEYQQSIIDLNNAISNAWECYNKQLTVELQAAIASALSNQPVVELTQQPTTEPTPTVEPTTIPSQNPTSEPDTDPTVEPTPTPESSPSEDEALPSPEPSPEPSPTEDQKETTDPEPSLAPTPSDNNIKDNDTIDENIRLISNLTNTDTLTKLTTEQKQQIASTLGIKTEEIIIVAELAKTNETIAIALEQFSDKLKQNIDSPMPYTLADATTEVAAEQFLQNPIGALTAINFDKVFSPSEWGKDMTDDQREKAQEVVIPVIIASNIVAAAMTRRT